MNGPIRVGSATFWHLLAIKKETPQMLARRFTIVCLLIALFGMSMSILVAEKSRVGRTHAGSFSACDMTSQIGCIGSFAR
jgi:hypothetical protein